MKRTRRRANAGCGRRGDRRIVLRIDFCTVAAQQNPFRSVRHESQARQSARALTDGQPTLADIGRSAKDSRMSLSRVVAGLLVGCVASVSIAHAQRVEETQIGVQQIALLSGRAGARVSFAASDIAPRSPATKTLLRAGLIGAAIGGIVGGVVLPRHCGKECGLARLVGLVVFVPLGFLFGELAADVTSGHDSAMARQR